MGGCTTVVDEITPLYIFAREMCRCTEPIIGFTRRRR